MDLPISWFYKSHKYWLLKTPITSRLLSVEFLSNTYFTCIPPLGKLSPSGLLAVRLRVCVKSPKTIIQGVFFNWSSLKVLSVRLHSKSHQKSSKCQNLLTGKNLWFFRVGPVKKKTPCIFTCCSACMQRLVCFYLWHIFGLISLAYVSLANGGQWLWVRLCRRGAAFKVRRASSSVMLESPSSITANLAFRVRSPAEEVLQNMSPFLLCTSTSPSFLDTSIPMLWNFHHVHWAVSSFWGCKPHGYGQNLKPIYIKKEICWTVAPSITSSWCVTDLDVHHHFKLWLAGISSPSHLEGKAPHLQRIVQSYFSLGNKKIKWRQKSFSVYIPFVEIARGGSRAQSASGRIHILTQETMPNICNVPSEVGLAPLPCQ